MDRRLHLNEMQVPLPKELFDGLDLDLVRFYPLEEAEAELKVRIAQYAGVHPDNVFIYSGIDGLIELMYKAFWDKELLLHEPTYYVYDREALRQGIAVRRASLRRSNLPDYFYDMAEGRIVVVVNPNNPTGNLLIDAEQAVRILQKAAYLVVDEAYYEFSGVTMVPLLKQHPNLVVFRTFSKAFGLAGARVGYMIADPKLVSTFGQYTEVYRVSSLSILLALRALENRSYMERYVSLVKEVKTKLIQGLKQRGIGVKDTAANFVIVEKEFAEFLEGRGFKVRVFDTFGRLTVPSLEVAEEVLRNCEDYRREA
ncbi:histidinol-phosphate aminotransferase family protein [Coprothermobacteraceae bacterium]|nr:histidinol-phosphate aminotransferase family protein [Coprothermobacteraceae bacterium]